MSNETTGKCGACLKGDHKNHQPDLGGICIGCACQWRLDRTGRFQAKSAWDVYSFGFFQGREYEALDSLEAMRLVGEFEDRQRATVASFELNIEARIAAAVTAERSRVVDLLRKSLRDDGCGDADVQGLLTTFLDRLAVTR